MYYCCPNSNCKVYKKAICVIKNGTFKRKSDSQIVQKFKCTGCKKQFSKATFTLEKYQKKRTINYQVLKYISSNNSMRRIAKNLNVDKKTIKRKLDYLNIKAEQKNQKFLTRLKKDKVINLQIDDLITIEHTKLKPLTVSIAIDKNRRYILGAEVSKIPAFGHLAKLSVKKYGYRKSEHQEGLKRLFDKIQPVVSENALIESDEHKLYPEFIRKYFFKAEFIQSKGEKSCVAGQGELKKVKRDPLFMINHTCAIFRANINRLIRKTWCSTKRPEMLQKHINVFIYYYNYIYLKDQKT